MTDFSTDTRSAMDACSLLDEEIAAFLDGRLSPEDCERITAHLASCESCSEVFAAVLQFQEEEGSGLGIEEDVPGPFVEDIYGTGVSPLKTRSAFSFPFADETDRTGVSLPSVAAPEKVRASRWLVLAASLLLVSVLGFEAWKFLAPSKMVLADVVKPLEQEENISDLLYDGATRGLPPPGDMLSMRPNFMAGVYLLGLPLSVQEEDVRRTETRLQGLASSLQQIPFVPENLAKEYGEESQRMKAPSDLARLAPALPAREAQIQEMLGDEQAFQLGLWAEAARLSALTESPEFFDRRKNSRFLSRLLKEETLPVPPDLHETVLEDLQAVRSAWDLSPRNYALIAKHLENVIRLIDQYEEEDFSSGN